MTIRGHVPEKDGIIAGLLMAEMVATRGKSVGAQLKELFAKVGSFYPVRENFHLTPEVKAAFTEKLKADPTELGGRKVIAVVPVGSDPGFIRVTANDQYALVLNRKSGDVAILSVPAILQKKNRYKTAALLTVIPVGSRPVSAVVRAV